MKRGDLVTVALSGDFGRPRPALVIQSDLFDETEAVTVLLLSGTLLESPLLRLPVMPAEDNGLRQPSRIQIDKIMTLRSAKVGSVIGRLDDETMLSVTRSLAVFLGIA